MVMFGVSWIMVSVVCSRVSLILMWNVVCRIIFGWLVVVVCCSGCWKVSVFSWCWVCW